MDLLCEFLIQLLVFAHQILCIDIVAGVWVCLLLLKFNTLAGLPFLQQFDLVLGLDVHDLHKSLKQLRQPFFGSWSQLILDLDQGIDA